MLGKLRAWKTQKIDQLIAYTERMVPIWDQRRRARAAEREARLHQGARMARWLWMPTCLLIAYQIVASAYPHLRDDLATRGRIEAEIPLICGSPQNEVGAPDGYYTLCRDHFAGQLRANIEADLIAMVGVPVIFLAAALGIPWLVARRRRSRAG
jgi:hypothetical protein